MRASPSIRARRTPGINRGTTRFESRRARRAFLAREGLGVVLQPGRPFGMGISSAIDAGLVVTVFINLRAQR
jgi:hypothetical protein